MMVFDWAGLAASHPGWIAVDGIHCTAAGYRERATAIAQASLEVRQIEQPSIAPAPNRNVY